MANEMCIRDRLLQTECCTQMQSNEEAYEIVRRDPDLFAWFCNIDVRVEKNSPTTDLSLSLIHIWHQSSSLRSGFS